MLLCDLTTCHSIERAWFQRLKVKRHTLLPCLAFKFNLRRYNKAIDLVDEAAAKVGWCRLIDSKPVLKVSMASALEAILS